MKRDTVSLSILGANIFYQKRHFVFKYFGGKLFFIKSVPNLRAYMKSMAHVFSYLTLAPLANGRSLELPAEMKAPIYNNCGVQRKSFLVPPFPNHPLYFAPEFGFSGLYPANIKSWAETRQQGRWWRLSPQGTVFSSFLEELPGFQFKLFRNTWILYRW